MTTQHDDNANYVQNIDRETLDDILEAPPTALAEAKVSEQDGKLWVRFERHDDD